MNWPAVLCKPTSCLENSFLPSRLTEVPGRLAFMKAQTGKKDASCN